MSVLASGLGRTDVPREPPPAKGCAVDANAGTAGAALLLAVLVGLALARARRR